MAFTLNGIGTKHQGLRWLPDGSYITTKWFVFFYVPLIPLGSIRVLESSAAWGTSMYGGQSIRAVDAPLDVGMVLRVYAWVVGTPVGLIAIARLCDRFDFPASLIAALYRWTA